MQTSKMSPSKLGELPLGAFDLSLLEFDKTPDTPEDLNQLLLESDSKHIVDTDCMDMTWDVPDGAVLLNKPLQEGLLFHGSPQAAGGRNGQGDFNCIQDMRSSLYTGGSEYAAERVFGDYYQDSSGAEHTNVGFDNINSDVDYEITKSHDLDEAKRTRKEIQKRYRERVKTKAKDVEEAITRAREELERLRFENRNLKSRNKAMEQQSEYSQELVSGNYGFEIKEKAQVRTDGGFFGQVELAASQRALVAARYMAQYLWTYFSAPSEKALQWLVSNMVKDRRNIFCRTFNFGYQRRLKRLLMEYYQAEEKEVLYRRLDVVIGLRIKCTRILATLDPALALYRMLMGWVGVNFSEGPFLEESPRLEEEALESLQEALEVSKSQSKQFKQQWDEFLLVWNHIDDQYHKPFKVAVQANSTNYRSLRENTKRHMNTMAAAIAIESLNKDQMNAIFNLTFKVLETLKPVQTATLFSYYPGRTPNIVFLSKLLSRCLLTARDEERTPFGQCMETKLTLG